MTRIANYKVDFEAIDNVCKYTDVEPPTKR